LLRATVENDLARKRVRCVVQDVGGDAAHAHALGHLKQAAQLGVFTLEQFEAQQTLTAAKLLAPQLGIFELHTHQGRKIHRGVAHEVGRRSRGHLQGVGCDGQPLPQHFEITKAQIGHQYHQAQRDEQQQANQRCRSTIEDRGRLMAGEGHPERPGSARARRQHRRALQVNPR